MTVDDVLVFIDANLPSTDAGKTEPPYWSMLRLLAAEVRRLRAERDELRAAGKLALARLCDGCYFETRDCPGNPEGCEAVRTLRAAIKGAAHE